MRKPVSLRIPAGRNELRNETPRIKLWRMSGSVANLAFRVMPEVRLIISRQNRNTPTDEEWEKWFRAAEALHSDSREFRLLVYTEGGRPTRSQLDRIRLANRTDPLTAIVSPSFSMRAFGSALTFINPTISCFAPRQMAGACAHLGLDPGFADRANAVLVALQRQMTHQSG